METVAFLNMIVNYYEGSIINSYNIKDARRTMHDAKVTIEKYCKIHNVSDRIKFDAIETVVSTYGDYFEILANNERRLGKLMNVRLANWAKDLVYGHEPTEEEIGEVLECANTEQAKIAILAVFMSSNPADKESGEHMHGWSVSKNSYGEYLVDNFYHMPTTRQIIANFGKAREAIGSGTLVVPLISDDGIVEWEFNISECSEAWEREKERRAEIKRNGRSHHRRQEEV